MAVLLFFLTYQQLQQSKYIEKHQTGHGYYKEVVSAEKHLWLSPVHEFMKFDMKKEFYL